jgi:hypothetical protein
MHERQPAAQEIDVRRVNAASVTWKDYRATHVRRIEYLVRLRTEQIRRRTERRKKPGA